MVGFLSLRRPSLPDLAVTRVVRDQSGVKESACRLGIHRLGSLGAAGLSSLCRSDNVRYGAPAFSGLSLWWASPVPSQCEAVNPVRPGREQPQRWQRVPGCGWRGPPPSRELQVCSSGFSTAPWTLLIRFTRFGAGFPFDLGVPPQRATAWRARMRAPSTRAMIPPSASAAPRAVSPDWNPPLACFSQPMR
jgi:hypothetical protein